MLSKISGSKKHPKRKDPDHVFSGSIAWKTVRAWSGYCVGTAIVFVIRRPVIETVPLETL